MEGFITAHQCDDNLIVGDFNVDFNRQGPLKQLVLDFMVDLDLVACDLSFQDSVGFTYERDDSSARSWIDHILSSQSLHSHLSNVHTLRSGSNLSVHCLSAPVVGSSQPSRHSPHINWSKASSHDIDDYLDMISRQLPSFLPSIADCKSIHCSSHYDYLDDYAQEVISIILSCSSHCIPSRATTASRRLIGWNDRANKLKNESKFWYRVWVEAGYPISGVLFQIKKNAKSRYKYEVRRLLRNQQHLLRRKLARSFTSRKKHGFWSAVRAVNKCNSTRQVPIVDGVSGDSEIAGLMATKLKTQLNSHSASSHDHFCSQLGSVLSDTQLSDVEVSSEDIFAAISELKINKSDDCGVTSEHLKVASPVIADSLASLFTAILRRG